MNDQPTALSPRVWSRPMVGRATDDHRHVTILELFFDLCFVVAVTQTAAGLHHGVSEGHVGAAVQAYLLTFFAVWWAWMNYTWFSSAFDTNDIAYALTTFVQIGGALVLAAGVPRAMADGDFGLATLGYVIMRLAMVSHWLRAARTDPVHRRGCLRFAVGVSVVQAGWVARLALPERWQTPAILVLIVAELAVPVWGERAAPTPWHPAHVAERYGLFTLIVLGETVLASTVAVQSALDADVTGLATLAGGGLLTVFAMWWLYFAKDAAAYLTSLRAGFVWGYGHYVIFGGAAAVGAGLAVNVDVVTGAAHVGRLTAAACFTVPVAAFLMALWGLQWRPYPHARWRHAMLPLAAGGALVMTFAPRPIIGTGLLLAAAVVVAVVVVHRVRPATAEV